jgi:hypothetical protein
MTPLCLEPITALKTARELDLLIAGETSETRGEL